MDRANACVLALTQEEYAQWKSLGGEIHTALVTAVKAGADPRAGGQRIAALHRPVAVLLLGVLHAPGPCGPCRAVCVRSPVHRLL